MRLWISTSKWNQTSNLQITNGYVSGRNTEKIIIDTKTEQTEQNKRIKNFNKRPSNDNIDDKDDENY